MGPDGTGAEGNAGDLVVRVLLKDDLDRVDQIFRHSFGTFLGAPDPEATFGDADFVRTRWRADPSAAVVAELDGTVVGSNFANSWGSCGFIGPLTVDPEYWSRGIARRLMTSTMEIFARWATAHVGLFTFPNSPRHIRLYQAFGFWPRFLTPVLDAPVGASSRADGYARFSQLAEAEREQALAAVAGLTGSVYDGLDVGNEIRSVFDQRLGDTLLVDDGTNLQAVAVCQTGAGSEAGSGTCYVKFAAAAPGPGARRAFDRLLEACNDFALGAGAAVVQAGVNLGRTRAYGALLERGFRIQFLGVTMHRPNEAAYDRPDAFVVDDLR